jgi:hypothetical protein
MGFGSARIAGLQRPATARDRHRLGVGDAGFMNPVLAELASRAV